MNVRPAKRRIGILGGMGPEATILLMQRIVDLTPAGDDRDHVPLIVDNNTQVPSRIEAIIEKTGQDPGLVLAGMAKSLEGIGAQALAMPCNTAHHYAPAIENAVRIPFLNMVTLSVDRVACRRLSNRRVGILASPAVKMSGIFDQSFFAHDIQTIYPQDQDRMLATVRAIKTDSSDIGPRQTIAHASNELAQAGADILLVACSELSIIAGAIPDKFSFIDTIDVLAESVVDFAAELSGVVNSKGDSCEMAIHMNRAPEKFCHPAEKLDCCPKIS